VPGDAAVDLGNERQSWDEAVGGAEGGDELGLPRTAERGLDDGGDCVSIGGVGGSLRANEHP
jgi:hypothetical protein